MAISLFRSFSISRFDAIYTIHLNAALGHLLQFISRYSNGIALELTNGCYFEDKTRTIFENSIVFFHECILFCSSPLLSSFLIFQSTTLSAIKIHSFKRYYSLSHNESKSIQRRIRTIRRRRRSISDACIHFVKSTAHDTHERYTKHSTGPESGGNSKENDFN